MACCGKCDAILFPTVLLYMMAIITELVSGIPLALAQKGFHGHCMLGATVKFNISGEYYSVKDYGSNGICDYCTYLLVLTVTFAFVYGAYIIFSLHKTLENAKEMWVLPALLMNATLLILKFISSCFLTISSKRLCDSVKKSSGMNCISIEGQTCFLKYGLETADSSNLYTYTTTAQSASWFCVLWWTLITIMTGLHYRRNLKSRRGDTNSSNGVTNKNFKE